MGVLSNEKYGEIITTALHDGLVRYIKNNMSDDDDDDDDEDEGGFYDRKSSDEHEGNNGNVVMELVSELSKFIKLNKAATDKIIDDYKQMQAKVSLDKNTELAELEQKFKHLQGKTEMAINLLEQKEKELNQKKQELEDFQERLDGVEAMIMRGNVPDCRLYSENERQPKKAGINPFKIERINFGRAIESSEYIDLTNIKKSSDNNISSFPGSHY
jgi:hypothetical protein